MYVKSGQTLEKIPCSCHISWRLRQGSLKELIAAIDNFSETLKVENLANLSSNIVKMCAEKLQVKLFSLQTLRIPDISFLFLLGRRRNLRAFPLGQWLLWPENEKQSMAPLWPVSSVSPGRLHWEGLQCPHHLSPLKLPLSPFTPPDSSLSYLKVQS